MSLVTATSVIQLTGDVTTANGIGSLAATVAAIQGTTISGTTGTTNVVFSLSPILTGTFSSASINVNSAGNTGIGQGVGAGPDVSTVLQIGGINLTGTNQIGCYISPNFRSTATASANGLVISSSSQAASYTTPYYLAMFPQDYIKGAGSLLTRQVFLYVPDGSAATNNAIISDNLSFTGNYFINYSGTRQSNIGGSIGIGTGIGSTANTATILSVGGTGMTTTQQQAIYCQPTFSSVGTSQLSGLIIAPSTMAASFASNSYLGIFPEDIILGAGSTVSRSILFFGIDPTSAFTGNAIFSNNLTFSGNYFINYNGSRPSTIGGAVTFTSSIAAASLSLTAPLPIASGGTAVTSVTTAPTATAFAGWDANSNLSADNFIAGYATTATAAGTTTLTVSSVSQQYFTGATTQTVVLPVTSTLVLGQQYIIVNNSTGNVTVQSSGANNIQVMTSNTRLTVTCILTSGTTAASWDSEYILQNPVGTEVSFAANITTTSATDVLLTGMTQTPVAGIYFVCFSTWLTHSTAAATATISIYVGGVLNTATIRTVIPFPGGLLTPATLDVLVATNAIVTVNGSQAIEIRWKTSAGTATAHNGSYDLIRIG